MSRKRIVIPTAAPDLPAPHFDDEATIVSARQVVPIAEVKLVERKRAALWISLILLSSAACGALGAIGVNYFVPNRQAALVSAPQNEIERPQLTQTPVPNDSDSTPKSESAVGGLTATSSPEPVAPWAAHANQPNDSSAAVISQTSSAQTTGNQTARITNLASDPGQLVRKRRVHPLTRNEGPSLPQRKSGKAERGAGRIQEIFEGQGRP